MIKVQTLSSTTYLQALAELLNGASDLSGEDCKSSQNKKEKLRDNIMNIKVEIPEGSSCLGNPRCPFFIAEINEKEDFCNYLWWKWNLGGEKGYSINCPNGLKNLRCPSLERK